MTDLLKIDVSKHIEKKAGLSYLSWAWAWQEVLKHDKEATWEVTQFGASEEEVSILCAMPDGTAFVGVGVCIDGISRECLLPVMDNRNKAIQNPNAFDVNKAIMRCLTKAIAMHGLGLYIYAGEDLPEEAKNAVNAIDKRRAELEDIASTIIDKHCSNDDYGAYEEWATITDTEEQKIVWGFLRPHSAIRSSIKVYAEAEREKQKELDAKGAVDG